MTKAVNKAGNGYKVIGGIADYSFYSLEDSLRRLLAWKEQGLCTEKELAGFIIQLFHQIPDEVYNDFIDKQ